MEDSGAARERVNGCFDWIEGVDEINNSDDDVEYAAWLAAFNPEDSPVPDEFISELLRINPNPHHPASEELSYLRLWRVRRLNELSANAQDQAEGSTILHTPDVLLATSEVDIDVPGSRSPPGSSALENERTPDDMRTRDLPKQMEGPQEDGSEVPMTSIVHDMYVQRTYHGATACILTSPIF